VPASRVRVPVVLGVVLALAALVWGIGAYPLLEPDEGRNAEVMRELAVGGPRWLPRLNGLPYVDKPILYYAAGAVSLAAFGTNETAARLPSLLFTLATLALVAWFARATIGRGAAGPAVAVAAAAPFTLAYSRTVICDSATAFWMTGAIVAFHQAIERPRDGGGGGWWTVVGWVAIGLGLLTKGPVALAVPLIVMIPYAVWRRRPSAVLDPTGMFATLAIVLPWLFAISRDVPDFLHYVLFVETGDRVLTNALGRAEPWWYFLPILLGAALPWSIAALGTVPAGVRAWRERRREPLFVLLALWIVAPLVLFSLSRSKRPQYVLPLVPPIALLLAAWWRRGASRQLGMRLAGGSLVVLGIVLLGLAPRISGWVPATPAVAAAIPGAARWLGGVALAGGLGAWLLARRDEWALPALVLPVSAIPVVALPLMSAIGASRSSKAVAEAVRPLLTAKTEVVAVETYPLSLPFYLGRTLILATRDGSELTSNYITRRYERLQLRPGSTLRPEAWWSEALALCDRPRLFVVPAERRDLRARVASTLPLRAENRKIALYGPCGPGSLARAH
jgi:4-amino-4-deoxy-L-arabinose transferase-like glycosyltransferase